jgi:hypothetical protein
VIAHDCAAAAIALLDLARVSFAGNSPIRYCNFNGLKLAAMLWIIPHRDGSA